MVMKTVTLLNTHTHTHTHIYIYISFTERQKKKFTLFFSFCLYVKDFLALHVECW